MKYNGTMVLSFLLIGAATLCAQPRHGDRSQWPDRIESYKKVRMLEALKLGEDESVKFVSRYDKHLELMHGFDKERYDLIDNLDTLSRSNASDGEFDEIYGTLLEIDKKIAGERQKFLSELKEILSNKQIAVYIVFERNFVKELRQAVRDVQRERMKDR